MDVQNRVNNGEEGYTDNTHLQKTIIGTHLY